MKASRRTSIILGIDPGLCHTGWGAISFDGLNLSYIGAGVIEPQVKNHSISERLSYLFETLKAVIERIKPHEAVVEETFVNQNPASALKLGMARGVIVMTPQHCGVPVFSYTANVIKKSVVGQGHADKEQVAMMVRRFLPLAPSTLSADAFDALACAICHAHHKQILELQSSCRLQGSNLAFKISN